MGNVGSKSDGGSHISRKELDRFQRRFSRLSNGQDRIDIQELCKVPDLSGNFFIQVQHCINIKESLPRALQRLLELHDRDGDGVILHEEFLSALCAIRKLASGNPRDRLALAFKLYDMDGDGVVSSEEMATVLAHTTAHGVTETQLQAAVQHCMAAHDADGDGRLAPSEFQDLVLAASQPAAAVAAH